MKPIVQYDQYLKESDTHKIQEAEEWAVDNICNPQQGIPYVSYKGMHIDLANIFNETYFELQTEYKYKGVTWIGSKKIFMIF